MTDAPLTPARLAELKALAKAPNSWGVVTLPSSDALSLLAMAGEAEGLRERDAMHDCTAWIKVEDVFTDPDGEDLGFEGDRPVCRIGFAHEPGCHDAGIPSGSYFILAPDQSGTELSTLRTERDKLADALRHVRGIIAEGAMTGFNCHSGDWAERLFRSQWDTHQALAALRAPAAPDGMAEALAMAQKALEPFAREADNYPADDPDYPDKRSLDMEFGTLDVTFGDLRTAREAHRSLVERLKEEEKNDGR